LKDAVQMYDSKNWYAITALVPGRTKSQCWNRWHDALDPSVDRIHGRTGKWTSDEDAKLKNAIQMHDGKNWYAIAALVPDRTKTQCFSRWHNALDPSIGWTSARKGKWTSDEDAELKSAVQMHDGKNWDAIARLVQGRTIIQCRNRWYKQSNRRTVRE
jgi:myb proto-oncogene protein